MITMPQPDLSTPEMPHRVPETQEIHRLNPEKVIVSAFCLDRGVNVTFNSSVMVGFFGEIDSFRLIPVPFMPPNGFPNAEFSWKARTSLAFSYPARGITTGVMRWSR